MIMIIHKLSIWWTQLTVEQRWWLVCFVMCWSILMASTLWFASETRYWRDRALAIEFGQTYKHGMGVK